MSVLIDIGSGHKLRRISQDGRLVAFIDEHIDQRTGFDCAGGLVTLRNSPGQNRPTWTMFSEEPVTLSPSLLCTQCGAHGFVRDGKWTEL